MAARYPSLLISRLVYRNMHPFRVRLKSDVIEFSPVEPATAKQRFVQKKLGACDDPNMFGTLNPVKLNAVDSLFDDQNTKDKGDIEEEKFLSFRPLDSKHVSQYETEIHELIKNKQLKEAFKVLELQMKEDKVKPSRDIYSMLLGACGRVGYTKKAFMLFNDMKKRGFLPTESHYTSLFNACSNSPWREDGLHRAKKLKQTLTDKNYQFNSLQYHAMIKAFGRCGDISTALEILDEMKTNKIAVTTETFNFLLQACISLPEDGFKYALLIWRQLRLAKVTPDIYSYNLVLRAARDCRINDLKFIDDWCKKLIHDNQDDVVSIGNLQQSALLRARPITTEDACVNNRMESPETALVSANESATVIPNFLSDKIHPSSLIEVKPLNKPEDRLALMGDVNGFLEEMKKDHTKPDIKTFSLMMETIPSESQQEKFLIQKLESCGIIPDVDFVNLLIKKRQYRRDYTGAKEGLELLQKYNLFPNIMTFGVLALGCRNLNNCKMLCEMMEGAGFRMNQEILGSLIKNAVYWKDCWYIMHLINYASKSNLPLNEKSLNLIIDFKKKTMEEIAKSDRGEEVKPIYKDSKFRDTFGKLCRSFEASLKGLEVELEPHPWSQYRF